MAVSAAQYHTGSFGTTSSTTVTVTLATAVPADSLIVVGVSCDNTSASAPTISSVSKPGAETAAWTIGPAAGGTATAAGAQRTLSAYIATTTSWASGTVITITLSAAVAVRTAVGGSWQGVGALMSSGFGANSTGGTPTTTVPSGSTVANGLLIGIGGFENNAASTADSDTTNGTWNAGTSINSTGGGGAANQSVRMQHKILTAAGDQTFNPVGANDSSVVTLMFHQYVAPAVTQQGYIWTVDATGTPASLAAQNTAPTVSLTSGNANIQLYLQLQSTNATILPATDDWQLQVEKNASGTWTDVTATSSVASGFNSAFITDEASWSSGFRVSIGTGTVNQGEQSETGLITDRGFDGNGYTEHRFAISLKQADLINGDTIRFRLVRNGGLLNSYAQYPTINLTRGAVTFQASGTAPITSASSGTAEVYRPPNAFQNTAETGLADGTTVTVANSDDGTAGNAFYVAEATGAGNSVTYEAASAYLGSQGIRIAATATSGTAYVRLGNEGMFTDVVNSAHFYFRFNTSPTSNAVLARGTAGGAIAWSLNTQPGSPNLQIRDGGFSTVVVAPWVVGQWYRVEAWWNPGTTTANGRMRVAVYLGDSTTPYMDTGVRVGNVGVGVIGGLDVGRVPAGIIQYNMSVDNLAITDGLGENFIGPAGAGGVVAINSIASGTLYEPPPKLLELDAGNASSYPGTGTTWTDVASPATNFTLSGSPAYDAVDGGGSLDFSSGPRFATSASESTLNLSSPYTIDFWVKPFDDTSSGSVFARDIDFDGYGVVWSLGFFYMYGNATWVAQTFGPLGVWQHLTVVFGEAVTEVYLNGAGPGVTDYPQVPSGLSGTDVSSISTPGNFNGKIAIIRIFGAPLNADQVAALHAADAPRFVSGPPQASGAVPIASATSGSSTAKHVVTGTIPVVAATAGDAIRLGAPVTLQAAGLVQVFAVTNGTVTASLLAVAVGGVQILSAPSGAATMRGVASSTAPILSTTSGNATVILGPVTHQAAGAVPITTVVAGDVTSAQLVTSELVPVVSTAAGDATPEGAGLAHPAAGVVAVSSNSTGFTILRVGNGVRLENNAETGYAEGTVVTTANSDDNGAGAAASAVTSSPTYTYLAAHGGLQSWRIPVPSAAGNWYIRTATVGLAGAGTSANRVYFQIESYAGTGTNSIIALMNGANAILGGLRLGTTMAPQFYTGSGTAAGSAGALLSTGVWYRFEAWMTPGLTATTGRISMDLYAGDSLVSLLHYDSMAVSLSTAETPRGVQLGRGGTAAGAWTGLFDDVATDTVIGETYIGPVMPLGQAVGIVTSTSTVSGDPQVEYSYAYGRIQNTAETGLASGTAVDTTNSDDGVAGTAFSAVSPGAGNTITYEAAAAFKDALGIRVTAPQAAGSFIRLGASTGPMATPTLSARAYFRVLQNPSVNSNMIVVSNTAAGISYEMRINTTGSLQALNSSGTAAGSASAPVTLGTVYRFEMWVTPGTTTTDGRVLLSVFIGDDILTPFYTWTSFVTNAGTTPPRYMNLGRIATGTGSIIEFDDIAIDDSIGETFIGPSYPPPPQQYAVSGTVTILSTTSGTAVAPPATYQVAGTVAIVSTTTGTVSHRQVVTGSVAVTSVARGVTTRPGTTFLRNTFETGLELNGLTVENSDDGAAGDPFSAVVTAPASEFIFVEWSRNSGALGLSAYTDASALASYIAFGTPLDSPIATTRFYLSMVSTPTGSTGMAAGFTADGQVSWSIQGLTSRGFRLLDADFLPLVTFAAGHAGFIRFEVQWRPSWTPGEGYLSYAAYDGNSMTVLSSWSGVGNFGGVTNPLPGGIQLGKWSATNRVLNISLDDIALTDTLTSSFIGPVQIQEAAGIAAIISTTAGNATVQIGSVTHQASGTVPVTSATAGAATAKTVANGVVPIVSSTAGDVRLKAAASGTVPIITIAAGAATVGAEAASGTVPIVSTASGSATRNAQLVSGIVPIVSGSAGAVTSRFLVSGAVPVVSTVAGSATIAARTYDAAGAVTLTSTVAGAITSKTSTSGVVTIVSTVSDETELCGWPATWSDLWCPPVSQNYPASGTALIVSTSSGAAILSRPVTGTVPIVSSVIGTPTLVQPAAGTVAIVSATAAAPTSTQLVSGVSPIVSTVAGASAAVLPTTGVVPIVSTATGAVTAELPTAGVVTVVVLSTVAGNATRSVPVTGTVPVVFTIVGTITASITAAQGSVPIVSTQMGAAGLGSPVTGTVNVTSIVSGAVDAEVVVSGTVPVVSTTAGTATMSGTAAGTTPIVSAAAGATSFGRATAGVVPIVSAASGAPVSAAKISGSVSIVSDSEGAAIMRGAAAGVVPIVSTSAGSIASISVAVSGTTSIVSTTSGAATASIKGATGVVPIVSTTTGDVTARQPVAGVVPIVSSVAAPTLVLKAAASGLVQVISDASASPTAATTYPVSGTIPVLTATGGAASMLGVAAGTVSIVAAQAGSVTARLSGAQGLVSVVSGSSGAVTAAHVLSGSSPVVSTVAGAVGMGLAVEGEIPIVSGVDGVVSARYPVVGDEVPVLSTSSGSVVATHVMVGAIPVLTTTSGSPSPTGSTSATVVITSTTSGTVTSSTVVSPPAIPVVSEVHGAATLRAAAAGEVPIVSDVAGEVSARLPASGVVPVLSTASGQVIRISQAAGVVAIVSTAVGAATMQGVAAGLIPVVSTASGAPKAGLAAVGIVPIVSTSSGTASIGASAGTQIVSTVSGVVTARHVASSAVPIVSTVSGAATPTNATAGVVPIISTTSGSVSASAVVAAQASIVSTVSGAVSAVRAASGVVPIVSNTTGSALIGIRGVVTVLSTVTGAATMRAAAAAVIPIVSGAEGAPTANYPVSGEVPIISEASGSIAAGTEVGSVVRITSTVSGAVSIQAAASGVVPIVSDVTGEVGRSTPTVGQVNLSTTVTGQNLAFMFLVGVVSVTSLLDEDGRIYVNTSEPSDLCHDTVLGPIFQPTVLVALGTPTMVAALPDADMLIALAETSLVTVPEGGADTVGLVSQTTVRALDPSATLSTEEPCQ